MVLIYGDSNCIVCKQTADLCKQYSLEHKLININESFATEDEFATKFKNKKYIPQIEWNGKIIGGYNQFLEALEEMINNYGENTL